MNTDVVNLKALHRISGATLVAALILSSLILFPGDKASAQNRGPMPFPGWQAVIDRPNLSADQQDGARFAAQHLPVSLFNALPDPHQATFLRYAEDHSDGEPMLVLCWEKTTPWAIVKPFLEIEYAGQLVKRERQSYGRASVGTAFQANDSDHWSTTASNGGGQNVQGLPITLTWSIVPDGTIIPGNEVAGEASNDPSNLRAWLAGIYGGSAVGPATNQVWFPIFQAVFDNIAANTGVRYVYEPNDDGVTLDKSSTSTSGDGVIGVRGDVRISGHTIDGNNNVLAYNYFSVFGGDMVIDTADSFFNNTGNNSLRLRNVVEHEHGHGLGLKHVCPVDNTKLMEPFINLGFLGVQFDDIFTIQRLYGDFLEVHGSEGNNDSFSTATPVIAPPGTPFTAEWVGIDDNSDTDYFGFSVPAGSQLTVRVTPSPQSYLEGEQNQITGSCTAGTTFDSSLLQNLGLTVYDPSQTTVLGSATSQPAGVMEEVTNLVITNAGTYYAEVVGSGANFNQLYRLEIIVGGPSFAIQLASAVIAEELFPSTNGAADPGETIRLSVGLENVGQVTATNLMATLTGSPGFQGFDVVQPYGDLTSGGSNSADFIFVLNGQCGDPYELSLDLNVNGSASGQIPLSLALGAETVQLAEDFEGGTIPAGWGNTETGQGSLWSVVASPFNPGQSSAFAQDVSKGGQSILTSPTVVLGPAPGTLSFDHFYDTELNWDGCVLEIQVAGGAWQDLTASGGSFVSGGYNTALNNGPGQHNPLEGRSAWSGDSGGFITTEATLPLAAAGQTVQFRWIIGHDNFEGGNGWYIENVSLSEFACLTGAPVLSLSSADTSMSEYFNATDTALVTVSSILPVTTHIPVTLMATGSADALVDVTGFGNLTLTAGSASTSLVLNAVSDGVVEGNESLTVNSPDATGSIQIDILDTPYGQFASTNLGTTGPVSPFDDFDSDNSINIEEVVFGTDLTSGLSLPAFELQATGSDYKLPAPLSSVPLGIIAEGETSTDLLIWTTNGVSNLPDGFVIPGGDPQRFLRINYRVQETAP